METAELKNKVTSYLKSNLNFYTGFIPNFSLPEKLVVREGEFVSTNSEEKVFLEKVREVFGDNVDFTNGYRQREGFLAHLRDVTLLGNTGAVEKDLNIVLESIFDVSRLARSKSFKSPCFLRSKRKEGVYTSIMHSRYTNGNIYHWTVDTLPRLYNVKQIPTNDDINLIVNEDSPAYQQEILSLFMKKDPRLKLVTIKPDEKWNIEDYWLPSFVTSNQSGYMPREYANYVRDTVLAGYNVKSGKRKRKIYVSRSLSKRRKLLNEEELSNYLETQGFETVHAEKLSYKDQVQLFSEAGVIISPHGAGLANTIFATDATVVEIHPEDYVQSHYFMLSKACGHRYHSFFGEKFNEKKEYRIDIKEFKKFSKEVL